MQKTLSKYHKHLLVIALILSAVSISIRGKNGQVKLLLGDYPALITILITLSFFLVAIYFHFNRKEILNLSNQIKEQSKNEKIDTLLNRLTERQKEVYDLIISGKTNNEIMAELFIEQSTLKSHINQIYKKLNIKNRKELKSNAKH